MAITSKSFLGTQSIVDALSRAPLPSDKILINTADLNDNKEYYNRLIDRICNEQTRIHLSDRLVKSLSKEQILKILDNLEYVTNFLETIENGN